MPRQTISLQIFERLSSPDFTWLILEYLHPYNQQVKQNHHSIKFYFLVLHISHKVRSWGLHALRVKIEVSYLKFITRNKYTDFRELVEIAERGKDTPPCPLLSFEL